MANKDGVLSIGIEYKSELNKMIADLEGGLDTISKNNQLSKGMKQQFNNVIAEVRSFKATMEKELATLGSGKVDKTAFKSFKQTVANNFKSVREDIDRLDLAVSTLNSQMEIISKGVDLSKITKEFASFEDYVNRTNEAVSQLIDTLGQQGISLFSFDNRNILDTKNKIKEIDDIINRLDNDTGAKFELFDEKEAQSELDKLSVQLKSTIELMEHTEKQMSNMDSSTVGFKKMQGDFALLQLKAASLNDTIEMLYTVTEDKGISIEMDDKSFELYDKYTEDLSDNLESIVASAKNAKKELSSLLNSQKQPSIKVSSEMNPNSSELSTTITIETTSSDLWKKLSPILTDLQGILNSNPVVAPVKLVVAPNAVSSTENGDVGKVSNAYSKKYAKVLAETGEDAVVDLEGVYKKTFTSVMDTAVSYAKETIGKIQEIFDKNRIGVKFEISQEEIDKIQNFVLSNKDGKKVDISGQITKAKQEVEELNESIGKTTKLLDDTKSKGNIKFDGFDKFTQDVSKSIGKLEELQNILKALQNIEITLAKASGIASITELDNQWANVEKRILNATKLDGSFRKNASVSKIASEYQKYIDMGGTNSIADIDKIKDNKDTLNAIISKAKEFAKQDLSNDSVKELSIELDGIIDKFDELIDTVKTATNALYKIIKQTGVSELDKQWSSIINKFKSIADESGKINLSKQKKDIEELLVMYQRYVNMGGSHTPFDLTDNLETLSKLDKTYKKLNETKPIDNSPTIKSETESFKQIEQSVDSLTKAIGDTKVQAINVEATAMEDAAEREVFAIHAIYENLGLIVDRLKEIKGIKIPKIKVENVDSPVESNISSDVIAPIIEGQNKLQDEIRDTIALTNEYGEVIDVYRGTRGLIGNGNVSNRYHGGTFWTSNKDLATQAYADENKITHANLYMKNPYLIQGGGVEWDELSLSIKQGEELKKYLEDVYSSINDIFTKIQNISGIEASHLVDVFNGQLNFTDFENGIVNPITSLEEFQSIFENIDFDNSKIPQVQNYIKELYDLFISFSRLSELSEKGVLNTNEITEIAKALQYDGVVFSQIYDGIDEPSDVFVTFEEKQSAVIDIISAAQLKLEEEQRRAELFVDTRKNFYDTLKTLSEEQIDEYVDKSAFKFVEEGWYSENLGEVLGNANITEPIDNIKAKIREYINGIIQEFNNIQTPIKDVLSNISSENSIVENQNKIQEELKETQVEVEKTENKYQSLLDVAKNELDKDKQNTNYYDGHTIETKAFSNFIFGEQSKRWGRHDVWSKEYEELCNIIDNTEKELQEGSIGFEKAIDRMVSAYQKYDSIAKIDVGGFDYLNNKQSNLKEAVEQTEKTLQSVQDISKTPIEDVIQGDETSKINEVAEATNNLADAENRLNIVEDKKSAQDYWQGRFKESISDITKTNEELVKMNKYYSDLEKMSEKLVSAQNKVDNANIDIDKLSKRDAQSDDYVRTIENYRNAINELQNYIKLLNSNGIQSQDDIDELNRLQKAVDEVSKSIKNMSASEKGTNIAKSSTVFLKIEELRDKYKGMSKDMLNELDILERKFREAGNSLDTGKAIGELKQFETQLIKTGTATNSLWSAMKDKAFYNFANQLGTMFSFYDLINVGREGFQTIRELDTALTEMKKVSDETTQSLKNYQSTTFDVGDSVGATAKTIQNSTADWMRLGESIDEAAESAKVSNILLNVSEFESIDEATESLVAMSQAYSELGKMDIVDVLNNIGNNYSIATDGLATALQKSASALKTANNDLNSAVALATAGNAVVQDPDSVGAGIRTISLRLVGTEAAKQELESIGEETDDVITTTSKLRDTILSATAAATNDGKGFDIFDSNGNYKSTYEIMQGLADLYDDIVAKDKELGTNNLNLLLETIAGKNRSNIAASILQNGEMLRSVYQDAQNSSGSAQKELDSYLDSIDGRMTQLENRAQEFWYKVIDSDTIKNGITLLTDLLEIGTKLVDTFGLIPSIATIFGGIQGFKKLDYASV